MNTKLILFISYLLPLRKLASNDSCKKSNIQNNSFKKVRLACIDAPEAGQPQGRLSTITLNAFVLVGTEVELNIVDTNCYDRLVAEVLKNNINQSMLNSSFHTLLLQDN